MAYCTCSVLYLIFGDPAARLLSVADDTFGYFSLLLSFCKGPVLLNSVFLPLMRDGLVFKFELFYLVELGTRFCLTT